MKSSVTQIALIALIGLWPIAGCERVMERPAAAMPTQPVSNTARYQIVFNPHNAAVTYLVDTQKGKVWELTKFTDMYTQPTAFNGIDVLDEDGEVGKTWERFSTVYKLMEEGARASKQTSPGPAPNNPQR
ncbi:MAG TPA: hypothetical protein VIT90_14195 [Lysobacter sp.]